MYPQNHYPVFLILEMHDRRSLQQAYNFQKYEDIYIITEIYESMKVQGVEKFEGIVVISIVGFHFLQEYLSAQTTPSLRLMLFFLSSMEETIVYRGWVVIQVQL